MLFSFVSALSLLLLGAHSSHWGRRLNPAAKLLTRDEARRMAARIFAPTGALQLDRDVLRHSPSRPLGSIDAEVRHEQAAVLAASPVQSNSHCAARRC